jgi:hypothetical protein
MDVAPRDRDRARPDGGLGVLNLGIFTRYADAKQLEKIASFSPAEATSGMQEITPGTSSRS